MIALYHPWIFVAVIIGDRADTVPERARRRVDLVPIDSQVGAYESSSFNVSTELSAEIEEVKHKTVQSPNGFSFNDSNEKVELLGAETNAIAGYHGEGQFNRGSTHNKYILEPPPGDDSINSTKLYPFIKTAEGEAFVQANEKIQNGGTAKADTKVQQDGNPQYQEETQANSEMQTGQGIKLNVVNAETVAKTHTCGVEYNTATQPNLISQIKTENQFEPSTKANVEAHSNGGFQNSEETKLIGSIKADAEAQANIASPYSGNSLHNWGAHYLAAAQMNEGVTISDAGPLANGYEVTRSPISNPYQNKNKKMSLVVNDNVSPNDQNNIKHWYPYTRPAEGETFVQAAEEIQNGGKAEVDKAAQGNGKSQYQAGPRAKSVVQTSKGLKATIANADAAANTYGGQHSAETHFNSIYQINSGNQYKPLSHANVEVQSNAGFQYNEENKFTSSAKVDAQAQANTASSYSGGSPQNWGAYYLPAVQSSKGAQISDTGPLANGYEVTRSPTWDLYQQFNQKNSLVQTDNVSPNGHSNIKNWYPYTRPAEGETFVQADGEIQNGAQENGKYRYQDGTQAKSVVQTNKELKVTVANADATTNTYTGYGGQHNAETQPYSIGQINSGSLYEPFYPIRRNSTLNGGFHYSGDNKLTGTAKGDPQAQTNIASSYSGGLPYNWGAQHLAAAPTSNNIKYGSAQNIESTVNGNTNQYTNGHLNGEGLQAFAKSHFKNEAQFGAPVSAAAPVQSGPIIDARFGETTHPSRRPPPHHGFTHPSNRWNIG